MRYSRAGGKVSLLVVVLGRRVLRRPEKDFLKHRRVHCVASYVRCMRLFAVIACVVAVLPWKARAADTRREVELAVSRAEELARDVKKLRDAYWKQVNDLQRIYDRGHRNSDGAWIRAADPDVTPGESALGVSRALFAARMAAVVHQYDPDALRTLNELQDLREQGNDILANVRHVRTLMNPAAWADPDPFTPKEFKEYSTRLRLAAEAAEKAIEIAGDVVPAPLPPGERVVVHALRAGSSSDSLVPRRIEDPAQYAEALVALTQIRSPKAAGNAVFLEEGFVERHPKGRPVEVLWTRRRVVVNLATGYHELGREYKTRRFFGSGLNQVYNHLAAADDLWRLEPPTGSVEPSFKQIQNAILRVQEERWAVVGGAWQLSVGIRQALAENDHQRETDRIARLDEELPAEWRELLFAIRGSAGETDVLTIASRLKAVLGGADRAIEELRVMASFGNRGPLANQPPGLSAAAWEGLQEQAKEEIERAREAEREARSRLPQPLKTDWTTLGSPQSEIVVRIRCLPPIDGHTQILQEVWRPASPAIKGTARIRRTVSLIEIDSDTGEQQRRRPDQEQEYFGTSLAEILRRWSEGT